MIFGVIRASSSWTVSSIASALLSVAVLIVSFCEGVSSMRTISFSFFGIGLLACKSRCAEDSAVTVEANLHIDRE
jgi:hypothetical protein